MALPRCFAPSRPKPPSQCHPNTQLTIARDNTIIVGQSTMVLAVVTRDCFSGWVFALKASHIVVVCAVHYLGVGHMWEVVPWEGYRQHDNERMC